MFKNQDQFTNSMFGSYAYDPIIKRNQDHLLVKINKLIDWSFVENEVADCYSHLGQNAIHPVRIFKLLIIQNLYNLSERDVMINVDCNILYRYFVGLGLNENVPHWTELGKFKERIGEDNFERLFYAVLDEAERLGIDISKKRNADSTDVAAKVDVKKCAKDKIDDNDKKYVDRNTPDKDAKFGRKESNGKSWYGYKSHINQDPNTELITANITTGANATDESLLIALIDKERDWRGENCIGQQGGDKGYIGHTQELQERGIKDFVIPRNNMKKAKQEKENNLHYQYLKRYRYKVEQKHAEGKRSGLDKARCWGRWKMHVQSLLIYLAINLKRIVSLIMPKIPRTA